ASTGDIGDGLADRHAPRGRRVDQRQRRALANRHRLAAIAVVRHRRHRAIGHRNLPGADHLIARHHAGDRAIADGDQEVLAGDGRQLQYAFCRLLDGDAVELQRQLLDQLTPLFPRELALHFRRLAEQHRHRQIDRVVGEDRVAEAQMFFVGGDADHGEWRALARADVGELLQVFRAHREYIALLRLVAPDFHRRHAGFVIRHLAQLELAALVAVLDQLGKGVRQTTGADVVNEFDRILVRHGPAAVDHFLAAALHLWVLPLHGGEIQILGGGAAGHRRSGAAAEPDQHGGAAQHNQLAPRCKRLLLDMLGFDVAVAAGNHDRLVIAAALDAVGARRVVFITAEITADVRATVFIVEGGAANGTLDHDVERGDDAIR